MTPICCAAIVSTCASNGSAIPPGAEGTGAGLGAPRIKACHVNGPTSPSILSGSPSRSVKRAWKTRTARAVSAPKSPSAVIGPQPRAFKRSWIARTVAVSGEPILTVAAGVVSVPVWVSSGISHRLPFASGGWGRVGLHLQDVQAGGTKPRADEIGSPDVFLGVNRRLLRQRLERGDRRVQLWNEPSRPTGIVGCSGLTVDGSVLPGHERLDLRHP